MTLDYLTMVELLSIISDAFSFPSLLVFAIVGIVAAFFGYYIFMKTLRIMVAIELGGLAYSLTVTLLPAGMSAIEALPISIAALVGIVFAVIGAIIARRIYKLFVFAIGAAFGAGFATALLEGFAPTLLENQIVTYVVMAVGAILFGILFIKAFRPLFIISSSLVGMMGVGATVGIMLCPSSFLYTFKEAMYEMLIEMGASAHDVNEAFETVGLNAIGAPASDMGLLIIGALTLVGLVVGVVAMVKQFKTEVE